MISHLRGTLIETDDQSLVIEAGGVGYLVFAPPETIAKVSKQKGKETGLWTHLAVRENALDLYGFFERDELLLFELLLGVSGIGPKSALAALSLAGAETIRAAVVRGDAAHLTTVSGIGRKTAEKIVRELSGKIDAGSASERESEENAEVIDALRALGYSLSESRAAVKKLPPAGKSAGVGERVREALKYVNHS